MHCFQKGRIDVGDRALFQLVPPERYRPEWKQWKLEAMPIIAERFPYEVEKAKAKQFAIVKELLRKLEVAEIIHAID